MGAEKVSDSNGKLNGNEEPTYKEQLQQRKQNAKILASHYTKSKRAQEIICMTLFGVFGGLAIKNVTEHLTIENTWMVIGACILSMILADILSGLLHWSADTWGSFDTPLVGHTFIRSFREHHVDPYQITIHDVVETNGDNFMLTFPALALISFANVRAGNSSDLFAVVFILSLALWVALTNQIHKWAHMRKPPKIIAFFQDWKIILSRKEHQIHHHNPFDRYYCITNGWLNPLLASFAFWKRLEVMITETFGLIPRNDDAYWTSQK